MLVFEEIVKLNLTCSYTQIMPVYLPNVITVNGKLTYYTHGYSYEGVFKGE